jgi:hypothetical protein
MTFRAKHEACGRETVIVVNRLFGEREYEGYCASCGCALSGFFVSITQVPPASVRDT